MSHREKNAAVVSDTAHIIGWLTRRASSL